MSAFLFASVVCAFAAAWVAGLVGNTNLAVTFIAAGLLVWFLGEQFYGGDDAR